MRVLQTCLVVTPIFSTALAELLGPTYPAPTDLSSSNSEVQKAWSSLTASLNQALKQENLPSGFEDLKGAGKVTWGASLFSLHDPDATKLQYHYTAPQVANEKAGTNEVDSSSIYRTASISKMITTFAGLLSLTDEQWNTPLSEVFPELVASSNKDGTPISQVQWDLITPWTLANQLSGIPAVGLPQGDNIATYLITALSANGTAADAAALAEADGFPALPLTIFGPCQDVNFACTRQSFIETIAADVPQVEPWATPGYSDLGFMILGAVISKYTGKPLDQMYKDLIFDPLRMSSSYVNAPLSGPAFDEHSVPLDQINGSWAFAENNPTIPSGGILSTIDDLNKLGFGILNSTLLSPVRTREWLKPRTHTASLTESIGAPWEIVRYISPTTGKVTDIYTKLGDSGAYGGMLALIPDYNAGFSFLNAYFEAPATLYRTETALLFVNYIAEAIMPALEAQAAKEAVANFVGTYVSEDDSVTSSLVVSFNNSNVTTSLSGLNIDEWISNSTNMLNVANVGFGGFRPKLQPTISDRPEDGAGQVAFRASVNPQYNSYLAAKLGPFSGFYDSNWDVWTYATTLYGGQYIRNFVFNVDDKGCAESVYIPSTRATLKRTQTQGKYIMRGLDGKKA